MKKELSVHDSGMKNKNERNLSTKRTKYTTCSMSTHNENMSYNCYCFILLQDDLQNAVFLTSKQ